MRVRAILFSTALILLAVGCANSTPKEQKPKLQSPWSDPGAQPRAATAIEPCADQLHELCRPLLLHYAIRRRMPTGLDDLRAIAGPDPAIVFECPVSRQPYTYNAEGLQSATVPGRIVLFDSTPAHDGKRWAVILEETRPGQPLIPRVVAIPESEFPKPAPPPTRPAQSE